MNITNLLEYNNKLRLQLNEDNKKYYEELLVTCRAKGITSREAELEIQLLEILQDLISYQNKGKNFHEIFGTDINKLSNSIIESLPKENKTIVYRFILTYILITIVSSLLPSVYTKSLQPYLAVLSILTIFLGATICFYLILYKKTERNKWIIYFISLVIFEISLFLVPILEKLNIFPHWLATTISISSNFLYIYAVFSIFSIVYIYWIFKKYYSKKL
jgi:transmembrane protein tmp6